MERHTLLSLFTGIGGNQYPWKNHSAAAAAPFAAGIADNCAHFPTNGCLVIAGEQNTCLSLKKLDAIYSCAVCRNHSSILPDIRVSPVPCVGATQENVLQALTPLLSCYALEKDCPKIFGNCCCNMMRNRGAFPTWPAESFILPVCHTQETDSIKPLDFDPYLGFVVWLFHHFPCDNCNSNFHRVGRACGLIRYGRGEVVRQ